MPVNSWSSVVRDRRAASENAGVIPVTPEARYRCPNPRIGGWKGSDRARSEAHHLRSSAWIPLRAFAQRVCFGGEAETIKFVRVDRGGSSQLEDEDVPKRLRKRPVDPGRILRPASASSRSRSAETRTDANVQSSKARSEGCAAGSAPHSPSRIATASRADASASLL
jgi:hypothetical protein